ncbi:hypothetical protein NAEGRDRAFT_77707 [Naegleria gruberi]|uniref:RUN domain-containing protein n=1 Tax=Naegleria gruberi TaxID=5762 RepID=D2UXS6_NAEGR|nr:uncharacterized protein NAEGRDRAFT_77707 [Naegleria gruberi]EFC50679.1 hypothetical protein NAEGRDRAFT_77707 [Naegleria gruberi]|eukprot:XP_002683423.1 hypothetical protein NAEGRDRAFT_77707 [Naegleria gruberi strain NEG-M]
MNSIKKESEISTQTKLKKLVKKLRGFKKSFSDLKLSTSLDKEYFSLSILYVYYLNVNGFFSKDFWESFFTSTEFLKEFFAPSSILYQPNTKEDLIFLSKKQSKFKIKNIDLFETSEEIQQLIADNLLIDFPNAPPIENLKSILAEIKCKIELSEDMEKIVKRKLSRSLLAIFEVGFRAFKFFGRYYFWDFIKFYVEKAEKTQGEIKDIYHGINDLVSSAKIKLTEPNDVKFVLFVVNAFNKRKLAEWFKRLSSLQQIGDYFTEESIIRSDKMNDIISLLEKVEIVSKSYMVEVECSEDFSFNYEKCVWNE